MSIMDPPWIDGPVTEPEICSIHGCEMNGEYCPRCESLCPHCGYYCTGKTVFCTKHPGSEALQEGES